METARRDEERDRKAAMDSFMRDQEARGVRSGGGEIAAMLGAQGQTSENRMLQDLSTQAGAVDRSMQALRGYGGLASGIRDQSFNEQFQTGSAADSMAQYNKTNRLAYDKWKTEDLQSERDSEHDRDLDLIHEGQGTADRRFGRLKDLTNFGRDKLGVYTGESDKNDTNAVQKWQLTGDDDFRERAFEEGKREAKRASEALKPPPGRSFWEEVIDPADIWKF